MKRDLNPLKLFISYSHKDDRFLTEFKTHLATLKRKGLLYDWCDKELVVGDDLDVEIKNNLADADLVAFIISADFLSSWSCYEVELMSVLDRMAHSDIRIIPIVVRSCKWKDTPLRNYLVATKNGTPIDKYDSQDEAWVEVADAVEKAAAKYLVVKSNGGDNNLSNSFSNKKQFNLSAEFQSFLSDTEVSFQHRFKETIVLDDIYVYPDLKNRKQEYDDIEKTLSSSRLVDLLQSREKILIIGSEQSGKTSLCKVLIKSCLDKGFLPLFCNGRDIKTTDVEKIIGKLVSTQYSGADFNSYLFSERKKILIVDDFDKLAVNSRHRNQFLINASKFIDKTILVANDDFKYDEQKMLEFADYDQYEILPFGYLRRGELIEKWNSVGQTEIIDITDLHNQSDNIAHHVDAIIRRNILPRKPIYVLTIIQFLDTTKTSDYSLTSYGHCYQSLIQTMLKKINIKISEFDLYSNYLSEFSYFIFREKLEAIDENQLQNFQAEYSTKYLIKSHELVVEGLLSSGILRMEGGAIYFGHRYVFYFYVSKYLSDHIETIECRKTIEQISAKLHTEKNANILIFLVHHTKDQGVIDELLLQASVVFDGVKEASLGINDTGYLLEYIASISKLVIEQRDVEEQRRKRLKTRDDEDGLEDAECDDASEAEEEGADQEELAEVNRSVRIVEVVGQILRNRHGSLTKTQLIDLCMAAYSSGLKFLNYFLTTTREDQEHILTFIQEIFKKNTELSDDEVTKEARKIFLMLCYSTSYSVIKKIANSVGSNDLMPIFKELSKNNSDSPAFKLIWIAIHLEFNKKLPKIMIEDAYNEFDGNPISQRLLQEIVIQHLYLNNIEYTDRQWISSKLNLPMVSQLLIQGKKERKN